MNIRKGDKMATNVADAHELDSMDGVVNRLETVQQAVCSSLEVTVSRAVSRNDMLVSLTNRLDKFFSIHKSSYSDYVPERAMMRVPVICDQDDVKSGVIIGVDADKSLMHNVLESGLLFVSDFPEHAVSNPVERKLLLNTDTKSLAIIPMIHEGNFIGTLNFASAASSAFSLFDLKLFDNFFNMASEHFSRLT